jgi:phage gpG-like protein
MKKYGHPFRKLENSVRGYYDTVWPQKLSMIAAEFFDNNFDLEGSFGTSGQFSPWKTRGIQQLGARRGILKGTGRLRRSNRQMPSRGRARVEYTAPYAALMHDGGKIKVTPAMRKFFWAMYYKNGGGKKARSKRGKTLNSIAQYYKNMALTKKEAFDIPARPFQTQSLQLTQEIHRIISQDLNNALNSSL